MDKAQTSRRALIGALALAAPVVALALGQCAAQPAHAGGPSAFAAAMERYRKAKAAEEHFDFTTLADAIRAHDQAEIRFDKANPHTEHFLSGTGVTVTTADWRHAEHERRKIDGVRYLEQCAWEDHRASIAFVDAYERRRAAESALPERVRMDAATDQSDALCDARCEARDAVFATPVGSLADLAAKFALAEESEALENMPTVREALRADIARLASGGLN